jgi:hypothetical protein
VEDAVTDPEAPLDQLDVSLLERVAAVHERLDPPPADLGARVLFALSLSSWEFEVARPVEELLVGSGARASERTRTITFEADSRTVMITVVDLAGELVRIDGWLAPAAALRVELRFPDPAPARATRADEAGRFVFDQVTHGPAQLVVLPPDDTAPRVVTPSLTL